MLENVMFNFSFLNANMQRMKIGFNDMFELIAAAAHLEFCEIQIANDLIQIESQPSN